MVFTACNFTGDGGLLVVPATPIPTIAATPRPLPTSTPLPTIAPTVLDRAVVESIVWEQVSACAGQIAQASLREIQVILEVSYTHESATWLVEASIQEPGLELGVWEVADRTRFVTPADLLSTKIASPEVACGVPGAYLAQRLTPPLLAVITPTPGPDPFPGTADEARLAVWMSVRGCFNFPAFQAFTAYQKHEGWVVEGRDASEIDSGEEIHTYGLWLIDEKNVISPIDSQAVALADAACFKEG